MALTDKQIKALQGTGKAQRILDRDNLYLWINANGTTKSWQYRYRRPTDNKADIYTIGQYPITSLQEARIKASELKQLIIDGIDPKQHDKALLLAQKKELQKEKYIFKNIAQEYLNVLAPNVTKKRISKLNGLLNNYIYKEFQFIDIKSITRNNILNFGLSLDKLGKKTITNDALTLIKNILEFAMDKGLLDSSPYSASIKKRLIKHIENHHPHVKFDEIPKLLIDIEDSHSSEKVLIGLKLIILLFPRAAELRFAKWEHIDWDNKILTIPSERMKGALHLKKSGKLERQIALSSQAVTLLKQLYKITGEKEYLLFATTKDNVISDATMNKILNSKGYKGKQDIHGFRGLASTWLNEHYPEYHMVIEKMLAHKKESDQVKLAYDHSKHLDLQRKLWQIWGDFLERLGLKF